MKEYKTVRGYLNAMRRLERNTIMNLKGYDKLSEAQKIALGYIAADISNSLGEYDVA